MRTAFAIALLAAASLLATGCGLFQRRPALAPIVVVEPPILLAPPNPAPMLPPAILTPALDSPADSPPDFSDSLAIAASLPPPPRRTAVPGRAAPPDDHPPVAPPLTDAPPPQLTTGLSPAQTAEVRQRTLILLSQTDRALQTLNLRRLNAEDAATRAQAGEYVRQARQALAQGEVVRAENLADKADTLTRFLLGR